MDDQSEAAAWRQLNDQTNNASNRARAIGGSLGAIGGARLGQTSDNFPSKTPVLSLILNEVAERNRDIEEAAARLEKVAGRAFGLAPDSASNAKTPAPPNSALDEIRFALAYTDTLLGRLRESIARLESL